MRGKLVSLQMEQEVLLLCGNGAGGRADPTGWDQESRVLLTMGVKSAPTPGLKAATVTNRAAV